MRYATVQGERTFADLVNRLYQLPSARKLSTALTRSPEETKALIKKAEESLRAANPVLADLAKIPPSRVIVVPPVEGLNHTSAALAPGVTVQAALTEIRQAVTSDLTTLNGSATRQIDELTAFQKTLATDKDWKKLIDGFPDLQAALPAIHTQIDQRITGLKKMLDVQAHVKKLLDGDLKSLGQVLL